MPLSFRGLLWSWGEGRQISLFYQPFDPLPKLLNKIASSLHQKKKKLNSALGTSKCLQHIPTIRRWQVEWYRSLHHHHSPLPWDCFGTGQKFSSTFILGHVMRGSSELTLVQSLGWEDSLEKEMATHSRLLAWKIPWTEEPGGLQSIGLQESDMT